MVSLTQLVSVSVENYVPHPSCVVGAYLSPFRVDEPTTTTTTTTSTTRKKLKRKSESRRFSIDDYAASLLLNICGKLLLFQCEDNFAAGNSSSSSFSSYPSFASPSSPNSETHAPFALLAPVIIASCVENVWIPPRKSQISNANANVNANVNPKLPTSVSSSQKQETKAGSKRSHLLDSLWLGCGHVGLKLWLPLNPAGSSRSAASLDGEKEDMFVSKRIIMTIPTQVTMTMTNV